MAKKIDKTTHLKSEFMFENVKFSSKCKQNDDFWWFSQTIKQHKLMGINEMINKHSRNGDDDAIVHWILIIDLKKFVATVKFE